MFKNKRTILVFVAILVLGFVGWKLFPKKSSAVQYQTSQAEKGTLVSFVSGSGSITSANNTNITTRVSGTVSRVYVTNGDAVIKGQKIADVVLDDYARERQTSAWVDYLNATVAVKEAINTKAVSDIQMWKDRQTVLDAQQALDDMNNNKGTYTDGQRMIIQKTLDQTRKAFSVSESKYLNSDANIANANAQVTAALRNYQENSATIVAPVSGIISNLSLAPGSVVAASSTTSSTSGATIVSSQVIGKIQNTGGQMVSTVNFSEIDITKIKANQKVTVTLDTYPDKTFTAKVLVVNTSGSISSGVTSYPVSLLLDLVNVDIYLNMSVNAKIITAVKDNVILVPSSAIQSSNGQTQVRTMKDGQVISINVETGLSNDTQTEITSGVNEGDIVVTSVINPSTTTSTQNSASPFGSVGGRGGMQGGAVRTFGR